MPKFGSNLGQFGPKWVIFEFSTKKRNRHFFRLQRLGFVQKIRKFQCAVFEKNAKNLQMVHFRIFGEKVKTSPFYPFFHLSKQKSENSNARFRRKSGGRRQRDRRQRETRVNLQVRIRPVGVGPKIKKFIFFIEKNVKNLRFRHLKIQSVGRGS